MSIGWRRLLARIRECAARLRSRSAGEDEPVAPPVTAPAPSFSWVLSPVVPDLDDLSWLARFLVALDALRAVVPACPAGVTGRVAPLHGGASTHAP
jgi:hypothetical protein